MLFARVYMDIYLGHDWGYGVNTGEWCRILPSRGAKAPIPLYHAPKFIQG